MTTPLKSLLLLISFVASAGALTLESGETQEIGGVSVTCAGPAKGSLPTQPGSCCRLSDNGKAWNLYFNGISLGQFPYDTTHSSGKLSPSNALKAANEMAKQQGCEMVQTGGSYNIKTGCQ